MRGGAPTRLGGIRPPAGSRLTAILAAARRWRRLAGPSLARRLPLLEVRDGGWIIGLPSDLWRDELARLARRAQQEGEDVPELIGRLLPSPPPVPHERSATAPPPPAVGAGAELRLRWLRDRLAARGEKT